MSIKIVFTAAAVLAMLDGPSFAAGDGQDHSKPRSGRYAERTLPPSSGSGAGFDNSARAAYGRSYDFESWPTDYLINRYGDHQAQGR